MNDYIFTNYDIARIMEDLIDTNDFDIAISKNQKISAKDFLNTEFYSFKYDTQVLQGNGVEDLTESQMDELVSHITNQKSLCLVEQTDRDTTFSVNLSMFSGRATLTFLIQENKLNILDQFISVLREEEKGKYNIYETVNGTRYKYRLVFDTLNATGESFQSPLGKVSQCTVNVSILALTNAKTFSDTHYYIVKDNIQEELTLSNVIEDISTISQDNTIYTAAIGSIIQSASMCWTITCYDFANLNTKLANIIKQVKVHCTSGNNQVNLYNATSFVLKEIQGNDVYEYDVFLSSCKKVSQNNDFVTYSINLKLKA